MKQKLVFLDIDGTLVDKLETIHPSTVRAVELARRNGHRLFISSGRYKAIMPHCIRNMSFEDGVFAAGAHVVCDSKVIFDRCFTPGDYDRIVSVLMKHNAMTVIESRYSDDMLAQTFREEFSAMKSWILSLGGRFLETTPAGLDCIGKFVYKSADCSNEQLQAELDGIAKVVTLSYPDSTTGGEVMLPDVNKSVGISEVLRYCGADIEDTVAIGDGGNDIEMLEFCKLGVAMGNAPDIVKAHADIVTDRIENDGLYKAFEMCGLI